MSSLPDWLTPEPWLSRLFVAADIERALATESPDEETLAALLSPAAEKCLESMAARAQTLTRQRFGCTMQLYVPLYLSSHCSSGCAYCGFAADRHTDRHALAFDAVQQELDAIHAMGFEEILLLTGERSLRADLDYLRECIALAARRFHHVAIEVFPMTEDEYRSLAEIGCTSITLYQETYHPETYARMHRWGEKKDFFQRLAAPERALASGLRFAGLGALLGLTDPRYDMLALYRHVRHLQKTHWPSGLTLSFPRIRTQAGGFIPPYPVNEKMLAQIIFAFRICLPELPLTLSTRESATFRDGIAGLGISKMSIASKTTVGGYGSVCSNKEGQFDISDNRSLDEFCAMLRGKGLDPVFKNWDGIYRLTDSTEGLR